MVAATRAGGHAGLHLAWNDITYDVELSEAAAQATPGAPPNRLKRILHGISAQAASNSMCAIMGPSGSGKTSLLQILTGRRPAAGGDIAVNGVPMDNATLKRNSGSVTQNSVFLDALTVRETLHYTALLRLGRHLTWQQKRERAEEVLQEVDLAKVAGTQVGNEVTGGISGGERRRLTVAMEIVHSPRILFLDEPSSGLDATSAQRLGDMLRQLTLDGCTVLCTIHQPRASLLGLFDTLLLLAEGRTTYFGPIGFSKAVDKAEPTQGVLSYFASVGYTCPSLENPADFLLDLLFDPEKSAAAAATAAGADQNWWNLPQLLDTAPTGKTANLPVLNNDIEMAPQPDAPEGKDPRVLMRRRIAVHFSDLYARSTAAAAAIARPASMPPPLPPVGQAETTYPESWYTQFIVLFLRAFKYKLREPAAVMTQASTAVIVPLLVGGIFWNISLRQTAIFDRLSAISFIVLMQSFMCQDQILLMPRERAVYLKDHGAGIYRTSAFFLSRISAELPFIVSFAWVAATISYFMFGFQAVASTYFTFCVIIVVLTEAGAAMLNSLGAMSATFEQANLLATLTLVLLMLFNGFYVNLSNLRPWCNWVHYFSFLSYGVQAAAVNQFKGLVFTCTEEEAALGCIKTGEDFLVRQGFQHVSIWANVGYMAVFAAGNRFVSYLSLRFLHTGQTFKERWNM